MKFQVENYTTLQAALEQLCEALTAQAVDKEHIFDCKLVACELLANALKHGDGEAELHVETQEDGVVLRVLSKTAFALPKQIECSDILSENGRGLFLVNTLCAGQIFTEENAIVVKITRS